MGYIAKKIDIKKIKSARCEYYLPVEKEYVDGFVSRIRGITDDGMDVLDQRKDFCQLLRKLTKLVVDGKPIEKVKLTEEYGLPTRVFNLAVITAQGVFKGTVESLKANLEDKEEAINRQVVQILWKSDVRTLPGMVKKLLRLYRTRNKIVKSIEHPNIHFGSKIYQHQEKAGWKEAYVADRSDRFGALGSKDEIGGNSTLRIVPRDERGKVVFDLRNAKGVLGWFKLNAKKTLMLQAILAVNNRPFEFEEVFSKLKRKNVFRKVTTGRVAITNWLINDGKHWYIHGSFFKAGLLPDYMPIGATGVDLNCDSLADTSVRLVDGKIEVLACPKREFDPKWSKSKKGSWFDEQILSIVLKAKADRHIVVLEYLDFEGCKRWLKTKLGAMLRIFPYREIRKKFERKCMQHGVILRYVRSNGTSLLGAIMREYPHMNRDNVAGLVIALRGMEEGNVWLEKRCKEVAQAEHNRLRINRKSKFGCDIHVVGRMIERQSGPVALKDSKTSVHKYQDIVMREISDLSKAMAGFAYGKRWVPLSWKKSGSDSQWHAVMPDIRRGIKVLSCAQL